MFSVLSGIWAFFICPETKGVTLEQMDKVFGGHFAHDEMEAKDQIMGLIAGERVSSLSFDAKGETEWKEAV